MKCVDAHDSQFEDFTSKAFNMNQSICRYLIISSLCLFTACSKDIIQIETQTQTRLSEEEALQLFISTTDEYQKEISLIKNGTIEFQEVKKTSAKVKLNYNLLLKLDQNKSAQIHYLQFNKNNENKIIIKFTPELKSGIYESMFSGLIAFYEEQLVAKGIGF